MVICYGAHSTKTYNITACFFFVHALHVYIAQRAFQCSHCLIGAQFVVNSASTKQTKQLELQ